MRFQTTALLVAAACVATACSEGTPTGVSNDQAAVALAYADADSGYFDENPGGDSVLPSALLTSSSVLFSAPGDPYVAPAAWGRHRRFESPHREKVIIIDGDTARVSVAVQFRGVLLVDTTFDGIPNPGVKPIVETLHHRAVFVRDASARRHWRLVAVSLANIENTDPAKRTVQITSMSVDVNGTQVGQVTDPTQLFRVDGDLPRLHVGDSIVVRAAVTNTTGTDLVPPTQLFLHVRNFWPDRDTWARIHMQDNGDGTYTAGWTIRRPGVARLAVDALDSETLQTETGDNYRSNIWAFPYRALQ